MFEWKTSRTQRPASIPVVTRATDLTAVRARADWDAWHQTIALALTLTDDDLPEGWDSWFCEACYLAGERDDHDPDTAGLHGVAAREYRLSV